MRIHILQHVVFEGPGYILKWADSKDHELSYTLFYEKDFELPSIDAIDVLVIMGGPMSVYDDHKYPWLTDEKGFIKDCILAGKKILGICLGAQLASICLGSSVYAAPNKEIGWHRIKATELLKEEHWLHQIFINDPIVFHWHGDQFGIPDGAKDVLSTAGNNHQAFLLNDQILGLQFHVETTAEGINDLLLNCDEDLTGSGFVQSKIEIQNSLENVKAQNEIMKQILDQFLR